MKRIKFEDIKAKAIYDIYLKQLTEILRATNEEFKESILLEINSHIFESLSSLNEGSEFVKLQCALKELGNPSDYLKDIVMDYKAKRVKISVKGGNLEYSDEPLKFSFKYGAVFLLSFLLSIAIFLFFTKVFFPSHTGLFLVENRFFALGFIGHIGNSQEVLQVWFFPIIIVIVAVLYLLLHFIVKTKYPAKKLTII